MSNKAPLASGKHRIVCFGELLMRLSAPGHELLLQTPRLEAHFGGAEANVAVSLSILGHDSAVVSTLPDNAIGHACAGELQRHGVDTAGLRFGEGRMGLYFLSPGTMQRPSEVLYDRADSAFARACADAHDWPRLLAGVHWLHVSGITPALGEHAAEAVLVAMRAARLNGTRVSFDCNYRSTLWGPRVGKAPERLREIIAEADLLLGNDRDIALILDLNFPQSDAQARFRAAADAAFTTWPRLHRMAATARLHRSVDDQDILGLLAGRDFLLSTEVCRLTNVIDRIGGGDAFAAGLFHGMLRGMTDADALEFAMAAACLKHSIPGDVNLLREADIQASISGHGFEVKR